MAEISGNSSNMVIIDTDGSVILDDDIEEYSGSLDDSGNITLSGVAVLVPCDGCFDDAKKGEIKRAFSKFNKGKLKNRLLLSKFVDMIAA